MDSSSWRGGAWRLLVRGDSKLVVDQVMKAMELRAPHMCAYYNELRKLEKKFKGFELHHSYRRFNTEADKPSNITSERKLVLDRVFASNIYEPIVKIKQSEEELGKATDDQVTPEA